MSNMKNVEAFPANLEMIFRKEHLFFYIVFDPTRSGY